MRLTRLNATVTSVSFQMALLLDIRNEIFCYFSKEPLFLHTCNSHSVQNKTRFISNVFANLKLPHHISKTEKFNRTD